MTLCGSRGKVRAIKAFEIERKRTPIRLTTDDHDQPHQGFAPHRGASFSGVTKVASDSARARTRGGHQAFDSEASSLITPPNLGSGGESCFPSIVVVAAGEPGGLAVCCAKTGDAKMRQAKLTQIDAVQRRDRGGFGHIGRTLRRAMRVVNGWHVREGCEKGYDQTRAKCIQTNPKPGSRDC